MYFFVYFKMEKVIFSPTHISQYLIYQIDTLENLDRTKVC